MSLASSIAIGLFLIYVSAPLYYGSDADYAVPQIVTILQDGNQNLDEYSHLLGKQYQLQKIDGHIYDYFPFGTVYLALVPASILTLIYDSNYISLHRFEFSIILASILMAIACADGARRTASSACGSARRSSFPFLSCIR